MPEPRILQAHRLNVSYARLSFMEPTPAALVNLFVGCYDLEFEPGTGPRGWPDRVRFELTRSAGYRPGAFRAFSRVPGINSPEWWCPDTFTALVDWPEIDNSQLQLDLRLEATGFSARSNRTSTRIR